MNSLNCAIFHPYLRGTQDLRDPNQRLEEACALSRAIDLSIIDAQLLALKQVSPATYLGRGRVEEIAQTIKEKHIELVVMDCALSPVQQRNLERDWKIKVLDRTGLILEIFGARAKTREGVLQVELAALNYARSRLVRSWTHLERQRGGLGFVGGAGETQIEADRRAIDDAINRLKVQLKKVVKTRSLHRAARKKVPYPIVALVGYTNAGKSTLFNQLTDEQVMAKDMLFATLDPTMRELTLKSGKKIILSDTVGFISDLPTQLVAAFRATLEDVLDADLILHIRDIAHGETEAQAEDVTIILQNLTPKNSSLSPIVEVWNKLDLLDEAQRQALPNQAQRRDDVVMVSALKGQGLGALCDVIEDKLQEPQFQETLILPISAARDRAWLFDRNLVLKEEIDAEKYTLKISWTEKQKRQFAVL